MVNNIVYFGRIIATILLIRLISLIRLIVSLPSLQGRAGVRLFSCQPLSRHSRATLVLPLLRSLKSLWTLETLETLSLSGPPTNFNSWGERRVRRSVIGATSSDSHEP